MDLKTRRGVYSLDAFDLWTNRDTSTPTDAVLFDGARVVLLGSCFCNQAAEYLRSRGYDAISHPAGELYNPYIIRIELEHVLGAKPWPEDPVLPTAEGYFHRFRKRITAKDKSELLLADSRVSEELRGHLSEADVILVLVGTTGEVWRDTRSGIATNEIPPPQSFMEGHWILDPGDLETARQDIKSIRDLLVENTRARRVFGVCPIPLYATWSPNAILEANGATKAMLRTALDLELHADDTYIDLWDWMQGRTLGRSVVKRDGRHFDRTGLDKIMLYAERRLSSGTVASLSFRRRVSGELLDFLEYRRKSKFRIPRILRPVFDREN